MADAPQLLMESRRDSPTSLKTGANLPTLIEAMRPALPAFIQIRAGFGLGFVRPLRRYR